MKNIIILFVFFLNTIFLIPQSPKRFYYNLSSEVINYSEKLVQGEMCLMEKGNNRGKHIKKYGKAIFGKPIDNFYYCLAGQYWAIDSACKFYKQHNPIKRTGRCQQLLRTAYSSAFSDTLKKIAKHDLLIWTYRKSSAGHTERVKEILNKRMGICLTYSFNTRIKGEGTARNGGGNGIKKRYLKHPLGKMLFKGSVGLCK